MTTLMRHTLYYVVIAMQLKIIISFNTIAHTNPPHNIISYTLNNYDSNTNPKYNDTLNNYDSNTNSKYNDTLNNYDSNKNFITVNFRFWDSSKPCSSLIFLYEIDYSYKNVRRRMYKKLALEKFTPSVKLSHVKYGEVWEIKVTKGKQHHISIYKSFDKTVLDNIKPLIFNWDININHKGIKIFKQKYSFDNTQKRRFISPKSLLQLLGYNIIPHWIDFVILKSIKKWKQTRYYLLKIVQAKIKVVGSGNEGCNCKFWLQYSTTQKFGIMMNIVNAICKLQLNLPLDNKQPKIIILGFKTNILYVLRHFTFKFYKKGRFSNHSITFLINIWFFNVRIIVPIKKLKYLLQDRNSTDEL